jgi:hypothetical protein
MKALSEWHLEGSTSCHATMAEAISLAKSLTDLQALAIAHFFAAFLAHFEGNVTEVERLMSALIELATRQNFAFWWRMGFNSSGPAMSTASPSAYCSIIPANDFSKESFAEFNCSRNFSSGIDSTSKRPPLSSSNSQSNLPAGARELNDFLERKIKFLT